MHAVPMEVRRGGVRSPGTVATDYSEPPWHVWDSKLTLRKSSRLVRDIFNSGPSCSYCPRRDYKNGLPHPEYSGLGVDPRDSC